MIPSGKPFHDTSKCPCTARVMHLQANTAGVVSVRLLEQDNLRTGF